MMHSQPWTYKQSTMTEHCIALIASGTESEKHGWNWETVHLYLNSVVQCSMLTGLIAVYTALCTNWIRPPWPTYKNLGYQLSCCDQLMWMGVNVGRSWAMERITSCQSCSHWFRLLNTTLSVGRRDSAVLCTCLWQPDPSLLTPLI